MNEKERETERRRLAKAIMPLIGPLLDGWDDLPNDVKSELEGTLFYRTMVEIIMAVGDDFA